MVSARQFLKRVQRVFFALFLIGWQSLLPLIPVQKAAAAAGDFTLCHFVGTHYNELPVSASDAYNGHYTSVLHSLDIIPPFQFDPGNGIQTFSKNWTSVGQAMHANHCENVGKLEVNKRVDTDGNGSYESANATANTLGFGWNVDGGTQDYDMGTTQYVKTGTRLINETAVSGYVFTGWYNTNDPTRSCANPNGLTQPISVTSITASLLNGIGIVRRVTLCNKAATGSITLTKQLVPLDDPGLFDLQIDGQTAGTGSSVGHNGTTGTVTVPVGEHVIGEIAAGSTTLTDYSAAISCNDDSHTTKYELSVSVAQGQNLTCTITNTRLPDEPTSATLTIVKDANPEDGTDFDFYANGSEEPSFTLDDDNDETLANTQTIMNIKPGTYSLSEAATEGWVLDGVSCVATDNEGFDNYTLDDNQLDVTLGAGDNVTCTFSNTKLAQVSGTKYEVNADSTVVGPRAGVTIELYGGTDTQDPDHRTTVTAGDGSYSFDDVYPGQYTLVEVVPTGSTQVYGAGTITLGAGEDKTGQDFGNFKKGKITGYKFHDLDGNGSRNLLEPKVGNWTIYLFQDDEQIASTTTSSKFFTYGEYNFTGLAPGDYTVCEEQRDGWQQVTPDPATDEGCYLVSINQSGETETAVFGNRAVAHLTVIKNVDENGDGEISEGETNSEDWTWGYLGLAAHEFEITTGASRNLPTGLFGHLYGVFEHQKDGYDLVDVNCEGADFFRLGDVVKLFLQRGDNVTCTFTNKKRAEVTFHKQANPEDGTDFNFNLSTNNPNEEEPTDGLPVFAHEQANFYGGNLHDKSFTLDDTGLNDDGDDVTDSRSFELKTGKTYYITEETVENWDLTGVSCYSGESSFWVAVADHTLELPVNDADSIDCYFNNQKRGEIIVTKYNDLDRDGVFDPEDEELAEPTLPGWEFTLTEDQECSIPEKLRLSIIIDCDQPESVSQTTGEDGTTTFGSLEPYQSYELEETLQDGWHQRNVHCEGSRRDEQPEGNVEQDGDYYANVYPGETVNCYVGNYHDVELSLSKSNSASDDTKPGDTITYSMVVSLSADSGASFNTVVEDLPPANFTYVPGSWTADSSLRGDLKAEGTTTEPPYGSPGAWLLGTLLPGEVVTLTYRAKIAASATLGRYTDVAFALGCAVTTDPCPSSEVALSNLTTTGAPFANSSVVLDGPQVLGASTLVNTGEPVSQLYLIFATLLVAAGLMVASTRPNQKGGRK